jgi:hypothetical protein
MKPEDITIHPGSNPSYAYVDANGKEIATIIRDDSDGLWRLSGWSLAGQFDAWVLRAIADRLDDMNRGWEEKLDAAYKSLPDEEEPFA